MVRKVRVKQHKRKISNDRYTIVKSHIRVYPKSLSQDEINKFIDFVENYDNELDKLDKAGINYQIVSKYSEKADELFSKMHGGDIYIGGSTRLQEFLYNPEENLLTIFKENFRGEITNELLKHEEGHRIWFVRLSDIQKDNYDKLKLKEDWIIELYPFDDVVERFASEWRIFRLEPHKFKRSKPSTYNLFTEFQEKNKDINF
jgi:hypothetical protein